MEIPRAVSYEDQNRTEKIGLLVYVINNAAFPYVVVTSTKLAITVDEIFEIEKTG